MTPGKRTFRPLSSKEVCRAYELLHERNLVSFPLNQDSANKIDALVSNITGTFYAREIYPSLEQKVVAYLYFIIKDHAFVDGNKRTAILVFKVLCELNDLKIKSDIALDSLAVFIEKINESDHQEVIRTLADILFKSVMKENGNVIK